jgi:cytochrome P450
MKFSSFRTSVVQFVKVNFINALGINYQSTKHEKYVNRINQLIDQLIQSLINNEYPKGALTTLLLEKYAAGEIAYKDVRDTMMNFLFAGFETTAAAITWTLHCLAKYPEHQQQVYEELVANKAQGNQDWNEANLPYLKLCIKEAMRLYPPVWFYMRQCLAEDFIDGKVIRKNSLVMICPFALHQHKDFWQQPQTFNPANFEKANAQGKAFAYIPFGQGKRMCIGHAFAGVQMNMMIAELLYQFKFSAVSTKEPVINAAIIIKGDKPIQLKIAQH